MKKLFCSVLISTLIAGCGGGSSSGPAAVDPNLSVPLQAAFANLVNNGLSQKFTIAGTQDNSTQVTSLPLVQITGSGTLSTGTPVAGTIAGVAGLKSTSVITGSLSANGQTTPLASSAVTYYNSSNYSVYATVANGATQLYSAYTIPTTVKAGSTGSFGTSTNGAVIPTTTNAVYTVSPDTASSLLVTIVQTLKDSGTTQTQTTYRVTTTGTISYVLITTQKSFLGSVYQVLNFTF